MQLAFLLLADHSEAVNGKLYAVGAGWNALRLPALPHEWGFSLALAVDVSWDETNRRHRMALRVEDPDGRPLGDEFGMEFEAGRPAGTPVGHDQRIVLSLATRLRFESTGPHAAVLRVGDQELGRARFYVLEVPPEAGGGARPA